MKYAIHMVGHDPVTGEQKEWDDLRFESDRPGPVRDFISRIYEDQEKRGADSKWANVERMYVAYLRDSNEVQSMHHKWEEAVDKHGTRATFDLVRPVVLQHSRFRTLKHHPALSLLPPQGVEGVKSGDGIQVRYFANRLMNALLTMLNAGTPLPSRVGKAEQTAWVKRVEQLDHYFELEEYIES